MQDQLIENILGCNLIPFFDKGPQKSHTQKCATHYNTTRSLQTHKRVEVRRGHSIATHIITFIISHPPPSSSCLLILVAHHFNEVHRQLIHGRRRK